MSRRPIPPLAAFAVVALGACGARSLDASPTNTSLATAMSNPSTSPITSPATVEIGSTSLGRVLADSTGRTLYVLSTEQNGQDACSLQPGCSLMWPAISPPTSGAPVPGRGVSGTLGVIVAVDGSPEVTYNGWPLHTFSDEGAGQVTGQAIASFGGNWYAATPEMAPVSNDGVGASTYAPVTPSGLTTPLGALPTNPFAPTTPPPMPPQPAASTIPFDLPSNPS
jgi:predicted lipoprotein with Yx(FWY)xxD motif